MGCENYLNKEIRFSESDDTGCLCTFPCNDEEDLSIERIRLLAYLGATVVLLQHGEIDNGYMPGCIPDWIKKSIDRHVI